MVVEEVDVIAAAIELVTDVIQVVVGDGCVVVDLTEVDLLMVDSGVAATVLCADVGTVEDARAVEVDTSEVAAWVVEAAVEEAVEAAPEPVAEMLTLDFEDAGSVLLVDATEVEDARELDSVGDTVGAATEEDASDFVAEGVGSGVEVLVVSTTSVEVEVATMSMTEYEVLVVTSGLGVTMTTNVCVSFG